MDVSFTNSRESIASAKRADTDWASLTTELRIRSIEFDGYVVIPDLLSAAQLETIRAELSGLPTTAVDYSERQVKSFQDELVARRKSVELNQKSYDVGRTSKFEVLAEMIKALNTDLFLVDAQLYRFTARVH